jgi:hypothetical protein
VGSLLDRNVVTPLGAKVCRFRLFLTDGVRR